MNFSHCGYISSDFWISYQIFAKTYILLMSYTDLVSNSGTAVSTSNQRTMTFSRMTDSILDSFVNDSRSGFI